MDGGSQGVKEGQEEEEGRPEVVFVDVSRFDRGVPAWYYTVLALDRYLPYSQDVQDSHRLVHLHHTGRK